MGEQYTMVGLLVTGIGALGSGAFLAVKTLWGKIEAKDQELRNKDLMISDALRVLEKVADGLPLVVEAIEKLRSALPQPKPASTKQ